MKKNIVVFLLFILGGINSFADYQEEEAYFRVQYDFKYWKRLHIGKASLDRQTFRSYLSGLKENKSINVLAQVHKRVPLLYLAEETVAEIQSVFCGKKIPIMELISDSSRRSRYDWELIGLFHSENVLGKASSVEVLVPTKNRIRDFQYFKKSVRCQE